VHLNLGPGIKNSTSLFTSLNTAKFQISRSSLHVCLFQMHIILKSRNLEYRFRSSSDLRSTATAPLRGSLTMVKKSQPLYLPTLALLAVSNHPASFGMPECTIVPKNGVSRLTSACDTPDHGSSHCCAAPPCTVYNSAGRQRHPLSS
jgi:hypothetical protein